MALAVACVACEGEHVAHPEDHMAGGGSPSSDTGGASPAVGHLSYLWSSDHFEYYGGEDELCPGEKAQFEAHFSWFRERFDLPEPAAPWSYFRLASADEVSSICPHGTDACAAPHAVYTQESFDRHELIHLYFGQLGGVPWVVEEGVAHALACPPYVALDEVEQSTTWEVAATRSRRELTPEDYAEAGALVSEVLREHTPPEFTAFYRAVGRQTDSLTLERFEQLWLEHFGESAEATWNRAQQLRRDDPEAACHREWDCEQLEVGGNDFLTCQDLRHTYAYDLHKGWYMIPHAPSQQIVTCSEPAIAVPAVGDRGGMALFHTDKTRLLVSPAPYEPFPVPTASTCVEAAQAPVFGSHPDWQIPAVIPPHQDVWVGGVFPPEDVILSGDLEVTVCLNCGTEDEVCDQPGVLETPYLDASQTFAWRVVTGELGGTISAASER